MDVHKAWAWLKIIMTVISIVMLVVFLVGGYYYFKGSFAEEEAEDLDKLRTEFKEKIRQVILHGSVFDCVLCLLC